MYLLLALEYLLAMQEIPTLILFSMNKYISMSEIFSNFTPVSFNSAFQLNPGGLKNDKDETRKILSMGQ